MGATALIGAVGDCGTRWVVAALFTITVLATQIIPTAALVVLMAPVALSAASTLGISPHLLMMTVAITASASFASPLSHPAHLLVMGTGGYRFNDSVKVRVPLTVVIILVSVWLLPVATLVGRFPLTGPTCTRIAAPARILMLSARSFYPKVPFTN